MIVLAVDTALGACSAAVVADGRTRAHDHREMVRGHAETLAPMVQAVMRAAGCGFSELDRVGVTTGPGTFTGQRVGLAFARGLGLALKIPVAGVTTLDAMAEEALAREPSARWALAAADAKRGEIYLGARSRDGALIDPVLLALEEAPVRLAGLAERFGAEVAVAGTAAGTIVPLLLKSGLDPVDALVRQPDAVFVAKLAASAPEGPPPKPLYLRPPDAKLPASA